MLPAASLLLPSRAWGTTSQSAQCRQGPAQDPHSHRRYRSGCRGWGRSEGSSKTLTAQHQALLGCLTHRLLVSLAQVNQLLDALLGLQGKGQGGERGWRGWQKGHSPEGKAAQGPAALWCRKVPHPVPFQSPFLPCPCWVLQYIWAFPQLLSPGRRLCRCVWTCWPHVIPLPPEDAAPPPPPHVPLTFRQPSAAHPATRVCTSSSSSCSR